MKRGFSLVELLVVLIIIGIGSGMFYSTLYVNWASFEKQVSLIDLQMEADKIVEKISDDGKYAQSCEILLEGKQVRFISDSSATTIDYIFTDSGRIQRSLNGGSPVDISEYIDYSHSGFKYENFCLVIDMTLNDFIFGHRVELKVSTQVFPRNLT